MLAPFIRVRQGVQNAHPRADALAVAFQLIFFVGRVNLIVRQTEADEHTVEAEPVLELADNGDRAANAGEGGWVRPFIGQRPFGRPERPDR
jgi:hypothetical protein